ncbi:hypothetical protein MMC12_005197 [Toensbergia leucococca]|nr:hypothetical protein [Toensbergia leucococca]
MSYISLTITTPGLLQDDLNPRDPSLLVVVDPQLLQIPLIQFEKLTESYRLSDEYLTKASELETKPDEPSTSELSTELPTGLTDDFDSNVEFQDYGADKSELDIHGLERIARGNTMAEPPYRSNTREQTEEMPRNQPFGIPPD